MVETVFLLPGPAQKYSSRLTSKLGKLTSPPAMIALALLFAYCLELIGGRVCESQLWEAASYSTGSSYRPFTLASAYEEPKLNRGNYKLGGFL